jgi:hypothetical protein
MSPVRHLVDAGAVTTVDEHHVYRPYEQEHGIAQRGPALGLRAEITHQRHAGVDASGSPG